MGIRRNGVTQSGSLNRSNSGTILLPESVGGAPTAKRYWRLMNWSTDSLDSNTLDLSEIKLFEGSSSLLTGITCTSNITWSGGSDAGLVDGSTSSRSYMPSWSSIRSSAYIQFDLGSAKSVTGLQFFILYGQPRLPDAFELHSSDSASSGYALVKALAKGSITTIDGSNYRTDELAVTSPAGPILTGEAALGTIGMWRDRSYVYCAANADTSSLAGWKRITLT